MAMSAASDIRLLLPPVTVTTGWCHASPRCGLSAASGPALARLVFETDPGAQVRRGPFTTGQVSSRQAAIRASSPFGSPAGWDLDTIQPIR